MSSNLKHPHYQYSIETIGEEKQPLLVIDNVFAHAESLIDYALQQQNVRPAEGYYPGLRAPSPPSYISALLEVAGEAITEAFQLSSLALTADKSFFSIVATPFDQLHPAQRIPHFDKPEPNDLAVLHYLCNDSHGGTSFYRHRASGFEFVDNDRVDQYLATVDHEIKTTGIGRYPGYINGDSPLFERIASKDAQFNRALIYRCSSLHSGNIPQNYAFDQNPRTGRFTVTSFLYR